MISAHYRRVLVYVGLLFSSCAASQRPVKIDDANVYSLANPNGIQFSSRAWNGVSQELHQVHYNGTYTWTQEAGSNLIFFFRGTAIALYAEKTAYFASAAVIIDGKTNSNLMWTEPGDSQYQQQIWKVTGLDQGDHQLMISSYDAGYPLAGVLGLDYLEVTPGDDGVVTSASAGPGASVIPPNAVLVDDSSDMIKYSGPSWEVVNSAKVIGCLGGTQHSSAVLGATATFTFNGTAVWYFSNQRKENTMVSISLDGGEPDGIDTSSTTDYWLMQALIWGKTSLADGPHTVTITHIGAYDTFINVDFFKYMPSTTLATSTSSTKPKSVQIGASVGGVVGGVALIALIAGIVIWQRRRRSAQDQTTSEQETYVGDIVDDEKN
ncbi:hypothetical protein BDV93DRAFT_521395 [Ceratobasidium sp. AG-I]|nr:hypothetical protein BDV93DRAFT_521395 [Ceratobasidium sp. AG-I]